METQWRIHLSDLLVAQFPDPQISRCPAATRLGARSALKSPIEDQVARLEKHGEHLQSG